MIRELKKSQGFSILEVIFLISITAFLAFAVSRSFLSSRKQIIDSKLIEQANDMIQVAVNYGDVCMSITKAVDEALQPGNALAGVTGFTIDYGTKSIGRALDPSEAVLIGEPLVPGETPRGIVIRNAQPLQGVALTFQNNSDIRLVYVPDGSAPYFTVHYKIGQKTQQHDSLNFGEHLKKFKTQKFGMQFLSPGGGTGSCADGSYVISVDPPPPLAP